MILTINEEDVDALIIKTEDKRTIDDIYYSDINTLLSDLGWSMSNISSCVISKSFITKDRCERYYDSLFIHLGVFVDALCFFSHFKVKYCPSIKKEMISFTDELQPHGWNTNTCTVWCKFWMAFVMSLPWKVTLDNKWKLIKDANINYRFLSPGKFIYAKINRNNDFFTDYKKNRRLMPLVSSTPLLVYDMISVMPCFLFQWMRPILKRIPKYGHNII